MTEILVFREEDTRQPYDLTHAEILTGDLEAVGNVFFRDGGANKDVVSGVVTCQPGRLRSSASPKRELVHVVEGEAMLELDDGQRADLRRGDTAIIQAGCAVTWTFKTEFKELFVFGI